MPKDKCQVSLQPSDGWWEYHQCDKPAVARIKDVVCPGMGKPFRVCLKHKKEFLAKDKNGHYEEIK
jgi:hypothetical protein